MTIPEISGAYKGKVQSRGVGVRVPPDLFTAIQQQLGLKLETSKAPTDVIAVDRVEKPTEN